MYEDNVLFIGHSWTHDQITCAKAALIDERKKQIEQHYIAINRITSDLPILTKPCAYLANIEKIKRKHSSWKK